MVLFRNLYTAEAQAVIRIFLDREGNKTNRAFKGPVGGAAIMFDPPEIVTMGLHIGEGVETCLAGRQLGFRPAWAVGSAGAIARLPIFGGVDAVTVFAERDDNGANDRAIKQVAARWRGPAGMFMSSRPKAAAT